MGGINSNSANRVVVHELTEEYLEKAASIYAKGLLIEEPPGSTEPLDVLTELMKENLQRYLERKETRHIWMATIEENIRGLLDFCLEEPNIRIQFICAIPPGQGVGTQLMRHLARFAQTKRVSTIRSTVSSLDQRAIIFYFDHLGFEKVGQRLKEPGFYLFVAAIDPEDLL